MNTEASKSTEVLEFALLLNAPALPSAEVINKFLENRMPGSPSVVEQASADMFIELQYDENKTVQLELVPAPYDAKELTPVCEHAWWWPEATREVSNHENVLLVRMALGEGDIVEAMLLLTILTAATASLTEAVAVYWADGALIHSGDYFLEQLFHAQSSQPPIPLTLWISFYIGEITAGKLTLSTVGMSIFGYLELEVVDADCEFNDLLKIVHAVSLHILETDIIHEDGETLELASGRKVSIRHESSIFDDQESVLRLEID